jgi:hypothetical protein
MTTWNRTLEREIRDTEHDLRVRELRYEQLQRMYARGPLGHRPAPLPRKALTVALRSPGFHPCAICARDFWTVGDDELAADGVVVCWICGDEHDPELTATVLADAANTNESWLASAQPDYFEHWVKLLAELGAVQRSIDLRAAVRRYQEQVRDIKALGLADRDSWLRDRDGFS